jgi:hypothetical protein
LAAGDRLQCGVPLANAQELIELPLGFFIAAIPLHRVLYRPNRPLPQRMVAQLLEGAASPAGDDAEMSIRVKEQGAED